MTYNQKGSQEPCSPMALSGLLYKEDWVGSHPPTPICYIWTIKNKNKNATQKVKWTNREYVKEIDLPSHSAYPGTQHENFWWWLGCCQESRVENKGNHKYELTKFQPKWKKK